MDSPLFLPSSDRYDSVLCSTVADVNWDSVNELVLGTYGQVSELLERIVLEKVEGEGKRGQEKHSVNCAQNVDFCYPRIACNGSTL